MSRAKMYMVTLVEKPWMMAPMTMMVEPTMIDPRRPILLSTHGMKGSERIAPSEYAAAMIPLREPCGLWKSVHEDVVSP